MSEKKILVSRGVRRARKEMGWSQSDLSLSLERLAQSAPKGSDVGALAGRFTQRRVSAIERDAPVDSVTLQLLAQALHVSVGELTDERTTAQREQAEGGSDRAAEVEPAVPEVASESGVQPAVVDPAPGAVEVEDEVSEGETPVSAAEQAPSAGGRSPRELIEQSVEVVKRTAEKLREKTSHAGADAPFNPPAFAPETAEAAEVANAAAARRRYVRRFSQSGARGDSAPRLVSSPDHVLVTVRGEETSLELSVPRGAHVVAGGVNGFGQLEVSWS